MEEFHVQAMTKVEFDDTTAHLRMIKETVYKTNEYLDAVINTAKYVDGSVECLALFQDTRDQSISYRLTCFDALGTPTSEKKLTKEQYQDNLIRLARVFESTVYWLSQKEN